MGFIMKDLNSACSIYVGKIGELLGRRELEKRGYHFDIERRMCRSVCDKEGRSWAQDHAKRRGIKFEYLLADAGYDTKDNYYFTSRIYKATPIIAMNRRNLKKGHKRDFEKELPVSRDSSLWSNLYRKRPAVERVFSRAKEDLCLKLIRVRRLERVRVHVAITLSAMLIVALIALKTDREELMNSLGAFRF